jgi:hypothetical protein
VAALVDASLFGQFGRFFYLQAVQHPSTTGRLPETTAIAIFPIVRTAA